MVSFTYLALAATAISGALAAPAAAAYGLDPPDFEIGSHTLARRQLNYDQNYRTSGNVNFQSSSNGYSVSFSGAGDFVVGKGWRTGAAR
jgi:endo-1,4-beta-xylanase